MDAHTGGEQVLARIGFAERWLHRARQQCAEGNVTRGVLTLALADAEMHHALEVAGIPRTSGRRRIVGPSLAVAAIVAASVAVVVAPRHVPGERTPAGAAPPVVRFSATTGELIRTVAPPEPAAATPAGASVAAAGPARPSVSAGLRPAPLPGSLFDASGGGSRAGVLLPPAGGAPVAAAAGGGTRVAYLPAVPLLSTGDFIDLVLVAERTLRSEPATLHSP